MHRRRLLAALAAHRPIDAEEEFSCARIERFVARTPLCFGRRTLAGHVTGSAWIVDRARERALLTHHRKLGLWLQLGGHSDGDPDTLAVALREAREESGLGSVRPATEAIFDVDVHEIPARQSEPTHLHYDVRWKTLEEIAAMDVDASVRRMVRKTAG